MEDALLIIASLLVGLALPYIVFAIVMTVIVYFLIFIFTKE